ncbi:MAG: GMC family oxidoreductase N-terminal domain-containing protein, partial [Microvirga sp.]
MIIDARTLAENERIPCDVCIVGTGPAAIALAGELAGTTLRVVLLESGGAEKLSGDTAESVAASSRIGNSKVKIARQMGGAANSWHVRTARTDRGIRLLPLAAADLDEKPWLPGSGWPLSHGELVGYCIRAQPSFGLPPLGYSVEDWEEPWARQLPLRSERVRTSIFQFGDARAFLNQGLDQLAASRNVAIHHHATVLELVTTEQAAHVTSVRVASRPGESFTVEAGCVVLAAGGLANAHLLLASDQVQPNGLGNAHDQVGRHLMDHPLLFGGDFVPSSSRLFGSMAL